MLDTLGKVAFEAFREALGAESVKGWGDLLTVEREAWRAAADAVCMYEHLRRPDNPPRLPGMTTITQSARLDVAGSLGHARRIEPSFQVRAGDQIGLSEHAFRVWRDGDLVADYAAGDDGVLRPVS